MQRHRQTAQHQRAAPLLQSRHPLSRPTHQHHHPLVLYTITIFFHSLLQMPIVTCRDLRKFPKRRHCSTIDRRRSIRIFASRRSCRVRTLFPSFLSVQAADISNTLFSYLCPTALPAANLASSSLAVCNFQRIHSPPIRINTLLPHKLHLCNITQQHRLLSTVPPTRLCALDWCPLLINCRRHLLLLTTTSTQPHPSILMCGGSCLLKNSIPTCALSEPRTDSGVFLTITLYLMQ